MSNRTTIWHIELYEPKNNKKHYFFGSVVAIYKTLKLHEVGISESGLYKQVANKPYGYVVETKKCIITKDYLIRSANENYLLV